MSVNFLQDQFRDAINRDKAFDALSADPSKFRQLCSAMDALGDTEMAISAYRTNAPSADKPKLYLLVYGLLQAMFVQQDAVKTAAEVIGFEFEFTDKLGRVREVRHCAVGHPTKRDRKKPVQSFGISRMSLKQDGFTLYSFHEWEPRFCRIAVDELLAAQEVEISSWLRRMTEYVVHEYDS